mgnify:CR=1 FL=1
MFHLTTELSHHLPFQSKGWLCIAWFLHFAGKQAILHPYFRPVTTNLLQDQHRPHNQHLECQSRISLRTHGDNPHNHLTHGSFPE